jgi:peptidoglycan L-alanyl-D-glutamate endopeptidase CwlK
MPTLSDRSLENLSLVDIRLRGVIEQAIEVVDFSVLEGHRGPDRQDEMFRTGQSKLQWPDSKHNSLPSLAVDLAPYPIDWEDTERFVFLAGVVFTIAIQNGIDLRWGGDWDGDGSMMDETFRDYVHFELVED